jgi:iron complex outermembrane receptor protein
LPRTATLQVAGTTLTHDFVMSRVAVMLAPVDVVVGSRARHTAAEELAVPVDVIGTEQIARVATTETNQILQELAPSVSFPRQSVADASDIVRPFTMRGLNPDHSLVLLNGIRRHRTALVHIYNAGMGAGGSGVDLNTIPSSSIERMEVLRDGAAAQYGSDAIAGVVNIVLRDGAFTPFVNGEFGRNVTGPYPDDGNLYSLNGGWGLKVGRGTLGVFGNIATGSRATGPAPIRPIRSSPVTATSSTKTAMWSRRTTRSRSPITTGATASKRTC